MMTRTSLRTPLRTALAAVLLMGGLAAPVFAQEATPWPELMHRMADKNKDSMVTRQEFIDMAARMWDEKHAKMMKADKAMKAGMMDKAQFVQFVRSTFVDPGQIGGN